MAEMLPQVTSLVELAFPPPADTEIGPEHFERDDFLRAATQTGRAALYHAQPSEVIVHVITPAYEKADEEIQSVLEEVYTEPQPIWKGDFPDTAYINQLLCAFDEFIKEHHGFLYEQQVAETTSFGILVVRSALVLAAHHEDMSQNRVE